MLYTCTCILIRTYWGDRTWNDMEMWNVHSPHIARLLFINKTSIQPILKSNSTSFMFNNIFCEVKGKKVIHWGEAGWGNGGTIQIASWKCNFGIDLDIQAITTLLAVYWFFICWFLLFIHFSIFQPSPEKWRFPALKSLLLPQFSTYRHRTGFILKRKQVRITNYLGLPMNW